MPMVLSHEQVGFFLEAGYLKVPDIYNAEEISAIKQQVLKEVELEREPLVRNIGGKVIKLSALVDRHELFLAAARHEKLVSALSSLVGPNIVLVRNRHNHATLNRRGDADDRFHRDILQPTRGLLTAIIYLEQSAPSSGCTEVVPGSHRAPFVGVPQPNGGGTWMDEHPEFDHLQGQGVPIAAEAGDVLLFDSLVFHRPSRNYSVGSRMSLAYGYRAVDELAVQKDSRNEILIAGEQIYRGNNAGLFYVDGRDQTG